MNKFTANISRFLIATSLFCAAAQADETPSRPVAPVAQVETEFMQIKTQLLDDLQLQLTNGIKQQATNALNQVVQTVKAMLP